MVEVGTKIAELRKKSNLTQAELGEKLNISPQAVSKWENGLSEPDLDTLKKLSSLFNVSTEYFFGNSEEQKEQETVATVEEKEELSEKEIEKVAEKIAAKQKPVLAVCSQCNKPIYEGKNIVRKTHHYGRGSSESYIICADCDRRNKEKARQTAIEESRACRRRGYIWGGILSAAILGILVAVVQYTKLGTEYLIAAIVLGVLAFPFLSCLFLKNNFVGEMVENVSSWGFVTFPGLIFSLDLDGIIWLLTVKLAFWVLGILLATAATILAVLLGMIVSVFVYPFALHKSFVRPEETDII